ncbi:MAG: hypothetical protein KF770_10610 [Anaerolineae bacterium]|nr:hypothetical protein [Anaerolineae bacterium]
MSKKNGNSVVPRDFLVDMPDEAPALGIDPYSDTFSWRDVLPQNYINLDWLEETTELLGGNPIATPARIVVKPVIDPEEREPDLTAKIVLEFEESNIPALVMNRTRCTLMTKLAGTPNPARWVGNLAGMRLELYAGAHRDFSTAMQPLFRPAPGQGQNGNGHPRPASPTADMSEEDLNKELFG